MKVEVGKKRNRNIANYMVLTIGEIKNVKVQADLTGIRIYFTRWQIYMNLCNVSRTKTIIRKKYNY